MINQLTKLIHITFATLLFGVVTASGDWKTNYEKAITMASKEEKYILINFTGSDWCRPCIKMKKDIFDKETFKSYTRDKLVLINLDFPRKKKIDKSISEQNNQLLKKYAVLMFPTIILLDPDGKEINRHVGYKTGGVENYLRYIKRNITSNKLHP